MKYLFLPLLAIVIIACDDPVSKTGLQIHPELEALLDPAVAPFYHGVASGDPDPNSVVIWTKITPDSAVENTQNLSFEVSKTSDFTDIVKSGTLVAKAANNFTVKTKITDLEPNTHYYYRFNWKGTSSPVGTTKTLPENISNTRIAFVSCSNYEFGYFHAYDAIAKDTTIDLVVHLGDYIYEYGVGGYGDTTLARKNIPKGEIISLEDYRTRYALYRLDEDLQRLHQSKPMVVTWDDHELANNAYDQGAQNHTDSTEGSWAKRKDAAVKAYVEWMPIADLSTAPIYRSLLAGNAFNLIVLDTRTADRSKQVDNPEAPSFNDTTRTILGNQQRAWFQQEIKKNTRWNIVANQVPVGPMRFVTNQGASLYMDGWDGYPVEREKILSMLSSDTQRNTVFVTGDFHRSFVLENDLQGDTLSENNATVEFIVTSVTSANDNEYMSDSAAFKKQTDYLAANPNMQYANTLDNGYLVLEVQQNEILAQYHFVSDVTQTEYTTSKSPVFTVAYGNNGIVQKKGN